MAKICIVGDYDSICGFAALGIDTFESGDADSCARLIKNLAANDYCIILITENAAKQIGDTLEAYRSQPLPAIIPVPDASGECHVGTDALRKAVEQAVGSAEMVFGA